MEIERDIPNSKRKKLRETADERHKELEKQYRELFSIISKSCGVSPMYGEPNLGRMKFIEGNKLPSNAFDIADRFYRDAEVLEVLLSVLKDEINKEMTLRAAEYAACKKAINKIGLQKGGALEVRVRALRCKALEGKI